MMSNYFNSWQMVNQFNLAWLIPLVLLDLILRGMALWRSARSGQNAWFIALLLVNSVGILPAIYLFFFQKKRK